MNRREVARKILALEFNLGNRNIVEGSDNNVNYVLTPFGIKANRVYVSGKMDLFSVTDEHNNTFSGILSDLTGTLSFKTTNYSIFAYPTAVDELLDHSSKDLFVGIIGKYWLDSVAIRSGNKEQEFEDEKDNQQFVKVEMIKVITIEQYKKWLIDSAIDLLSRIDAMIEYMKTSNKLDIFNTESRVKDDNNNIFTESIKEYKLVNEDLLIKTKDRLHTDIKDFLGEQHVLKNSLNAEGTKTVIERIKQIAEKNTSEEIDHKKIYASIPELSEKDVDNILERLHAQGNILLTKRGGIKYISDDIED